MTFYLLKNITNDKMKSELQRFYNSNNIRPKSTTEGFIHFEKGSVWGISSNSFLVQGNMRFQSFEEIITCNITFSRKKVYSVNSLTGIVLAVLIGCFLLIFRDQLLFTPIFWNLGWIFALLYVVVFAAFIELYLVEAAERRFLEIFETWFESYL